MKYKLHIAYANREDLCREAVASVQAIGRIHLWPNGDNWRSLGEDFPLDQKIACVSKLPPMAPVSIINMLIQDSWYDDVMFWMHNDALALPGVAERILARVTQLHESGERWGALFTCYDVLCAFNMQAVREVGYWDPMFFQYTADPEYYHRMRKAGWHILEFGPGVIHRIGAVGPGDSHDNGSATVRSDPNFNRRVQFREQNGFDKRYYEFKWGGLPGSETYDEPFGGPIR